MDGEAVLQAVRAAGVLGHVAADRAHLLARRIRRVEVPVGGHRLRHLEIRHAGLDDDPLGVEIDLEHPVHARERDHDPLGDRQRAAGEAGAGAARDERDAVCRTGAHDRLHLVRRLREDRRAQGSRGVQ